MPKINWFLSISSENSFSLFNAIGDFIIDTMDSCFFYSLARSLYLSLSLPPSLSLLHSFDCLWFLFIHLVFAGSFVFCTAFSIEIGDYTMSQRACAPTMTTTESQCNKCQRFEMVVIAKINNICILYLVAYQLYHFPLNFKPLNGVFFFSLSLSPLTIWMRKIGNIEIALWFHFVNSTFLSRNE